MKKFILSLLGALLLIGCSGEVYVGDDPTPYNHHQWQTHPGYYRYRPAPPPPRKPVYKYRIPKKKAIDKHHQPKHQHYYYYDRSGHQVRR